MKQLRLDIIFRLAAFGAFLLLMPEVAVAEPHKLTCGPQKTIGEFLNILNPGTPGDTLFVSGTCVENLVIGRSNITIDGQGTATIIAADPSRDTVRVVGATRVTIKGFTITGGQTGIHVARGAEATINNNVIEDNAEDGIGVHPHSFARIINNKIRENTRHGISVAGSSGAHIGVFGGQDPAASPNTISENGLDGVLVTRSASVRVVGNTIKKNKRNGINVRQVSHGQISDNTINGNNGDGIQVSQNSGVNLGNDTGATIYDLPNKTTVNNGGFGINCFITSYANGRIGTLNGASGAKSFPSGCVDSLIP